METGSFSYPYNPIHSEYSSIRGFKGPSNSSGATDEILTVVQTSEGLFSPYDFSFCHTRLSSNKTQCSFYPYYEKQDSSLHWVTWDEYSNSYIATTSSFNPSDHNRAYTFYYVEEYSLGFIANQSMIYSESYPCWLTSDGRGTVYLFFILNNVESAVSVLDLTTEEVSLVIIPTLTSSNTVVFWATYNAARSQSNRKTTFTALYINWSNYNYTLVELLFDGESFTVGSVKPMTAALYLADIFISPLIDLSSDGSSLFVFGKFWSNTVWLWSSTLPATLIR